MAWHPVKGTQIARLDFLLGNQRLPFNLWLLTMEISKKNKKQKRKNSADHSVIQMSLSKHQSN